MKLVILILIFFLFTRCAIGPTSGFIYTKNAFPGEFNSNNNVSVNKRAIDCQKSIFAIVAWGQAGAGRIAFENKIQRIATIDHSTQGKRI
jgi:TRL-like protein family